MGDNVKRTIFSFILLISIFIMPVMASTSNELEWAINQHVTFVNPNMACISGCTEAWTGTIIDTYYWMVLIKYEDGTTHWLNFNLVTEMPDLQGGVVS
jgi:hypothetical protein